jgi:hypothetical protein
MAAALSGATVSQLRHWRNPRTGPLLAPEIAAERQEGAYGPGLAHGAIISAMPKVMEDLETSSGQRLVRIVALDPTPARRFAITDPRRDPPSPYWPR